MTDTPTPKVRLVPPTVYDIAHLAGDMRPDEQAQWLALTGFEAYDPDRAAQSIIATLGPLAFCMVDRDNLPIAVGGFVQDRPGVFQTWMMGTPSGWETYWREITRHSRKMMDRLLASGTAHRVQTHALASRTAAHAWYERLGMTREGTLRRFFADGQDAVVYSKVSP